MIFRSRAKFSTAWTRPFRRSSPKLMFEGPESELTLTANAQPALMASSIAALKVLEIEFGLNVRSDISFVAGHSLGEYSALCAAESLRSRTPPNCSVCEARRCRRPFLLARARWRQSSVSNSASVTKIATQAARDLYLTGAVCQAANDNGGRTSGHLGNENCRRTGDGACQTRRRKANSSSARIRAFPLRADVFCCGGDGGGAEAGRNPSPAAALVANVTASAVEDPEAIRSGLVAQVTGTVRWRESVAYMRDEGRFAFCRGGNRQGAGWPYQTNRRRERPSLASGRLPMRLPIAATLNIEKKLRGTDRVRSGRQNRPDHRSFRRLRRRDSTRASRSGR